MNFLRNLSIKNKLLGIILFVTIFSIGTGFTVVIVNDIKTFKRDMVESTTLVARVIGDYSAVDLAFHDRDASERTLSKLKAFRNIDYAYLFDLKGKLFSAYSKEGEPPAPPPLSEPAAEFHGEYLDVYQIVSENDHDFGTIYLRANVQPLVAKIRSYLITMVSLMALLIVVSVVLAFKLQRFISGPILDLADAAKQITKGEDYSIRVKKSGDDEIGVLCDGFNEMLVQIETRQQERDRAEAALKLSERRFRHIVEQSNDALYVLKGNQFVFVNPKFVEYLGYTQEETSSPDFNAEDLVAPESMSLFLERSERRERGEAIPGQYVFKAVSKSRKVIDFEANVASIEWEGGPAVLGLLRDVTDRIQAEQKLREQQEQLWLYAGELERSNRELDQFAYVTSHDLKAPLQAISNLSEWIEEDLGDRVTGESAKHMDLMRKRVRRMVALIEGILEFSRVRRIHEKPEVVDVGKMLVDVIDLISRPAEFTIKVSDGMPAFETERIRLQQVFANLISNAVKHHDRPDGTVEVSVRDAGELFEFSVADDGPGIAPEYHEKVFLIFQTLKPRDKFESTGVGLALVKRIVEDKGGRVELLSKEGQGAIFRFTWPKKPRGNP